MDEKPTFEMQVKALEGSIEKWQGVFDGKLSDEKGSNCPLCLLNKCCYDCILVTHGWSRLQCQNTPYIAWHDHITDDGILGRRANTPERQELAMKELEYLRSTRAMFP
jgi:hypothetical protein